VTIIHLKRGQERNFGGWKSLFSFSKKGEEAEKVGKARGGKKKKNPTA